MLKHYIVHIQYLTNWSYSANLHTLSRTYIHILFI